MIGVVTSNNSTILRQLGSPAFQRMGVVHSVAQDAAAFEAEVRARAPRVAILDVELPGDSGYEVCQRIKADPELASTRVVLIVEDPITQEVIERLGRSRCDEVLTLPAGSELLFRKISALLGLPRRVRRRMSVELEAVVESGRKRFAGRILDLSPDGARLELPERLPKIAEPRVVITPTAGQPMVVGCKIVWEQPRDGGDAHYGLQFLGAADSVRRALTDLSLFELIPRSEGGVRVALQGDFMEHTDFGRLARRLEGEVEFDLEWVRYLNSAGVRHWVDFLRELDQVTAYRFVNCSVAFVTQASMVPGVLGKGEITSLHLPYCCDQCGVEVDRLLAVDVLLARGRFPPDPPDFACAECRGGLVFDDIPRRFFAFLEGTAA